MALGDAAWDPLPERPFAHCGPQEIIREIARSRPLGADGSKGFKASARGAPVPVFQVATAGHVPACLPVCARAHVRRCWC